MEKKRFGEERIIAILREAEKQKGVRSLLATRAAHVALLRIRSRSGYSRA